MGSGKRIWKKKGRIEKRERESSVKSVWKKRETIERVI